MSTDGQRGRIGCGASGGMYRQIIFDLKKKISIYGQRDRMGLGALDDKYLPQILDESTVYDKKILLQRRRKCPLNVRRIIKSNCFPSSIYQSMIINDQ